MEPPHTRRREMEKESIPDALAAFDKELAKIEKEFNDPLFFEQATVDELQACLEMADNIIIAIARFKMSVGNIVRFREGV
jgi:hypothetical protein